MFSFRYLASMFMILLGSIDCLTTAVGTLFFGTQELNPIIAQLVETNLPMFVVIKLTATFFVGVIFIFAERMLASERKREDHNLKVAYSILRGAYVAIIGFLVFVVVNNIIVLMAVA